MNLYGIRNKETGVPIGFSTFANNGEFCNDVGAQFDLRGVDRGDTMVYMVPSKSTALRALEEDPDWYNSGPERPQWPEKFNPSNWEVFEISVPVIGE